MSGSGRLLGKGNQYTESGAISVGKGGSYTESGGVTGKNTISTASFGNARNVRLGKGASLTITQPGAAPLSGTTSSQPISSTTTTAPADNSGSGSSGLNNSAPLGDNSGNSSGTSSSTTPSTASGNWYDTIPGADQVISFWSGLSTMQQVAAAAAVGLIIWFFIHRRKGA